MKSLGLMLAVSLSALMSTPASAQAGTEPAAGGPTTVPAAQGSVAVPADTVQGEPVNTAPAQQAALDGDIIVTANRVESLASKTPVALTAITGEGLRTAGITNPTALAETVPNLAIDRNGPGLQITIRGITSNDQTEKGDPSAAFLSDGIYIARPQAQEVSFFDVARVEVLRGPQGTLYGRNTTAGVINVITNRPTFEFGGSGDVSYGRFDAVQASAVLNVPISGNIAVRGSVNYDRRDNYLVAGPALTGRINPFKENISGRLQALFRWDSGNLLIRGDYSDIGGSPYDILPLRNFYDATPNDVDPVYIGNRRTSRQLRSINAPIGWDTSRDNYTWGIGAELTQDVGPLALTYLGSYRKFERDENDARILTDGSAAFRLAFAGKFEQNSQEVRLATNGTGPLSLQAGGYYFRETGSIGQRLLLGLPNSGPTGDGTTLGFFNDSVVSESYAFFGQGTYELFDRLRLTGGVRYSHDDKSRTGFVGSCVSFFNCSFASGATRTSTNNAEGSFAKTTWRGGVDFDVTPTTLLYGNVSTGYKAGGFNDGCVVGTGAGCTQSADFFFYDPETLTAYEAGLKTRFLDNAVRLNLAAFYYDYSNIQLSQLVAECFGPGSAPCNVTVNGGKARVKGVEAEGVVTPSLRDRFDFSVSYLDAEYTEFRPIPTVSFAGRPLDRAPDWTFTAGYQHTFPIGESTIVAGVRTRVSDSYTLAALNTRNFYRQPSYSKTDATITYNAPGNAWYLQGFVKNLEDAIVVTTVAFGVRSSAQISDPRTYGVRAGFRF